MWRDENTPDPVFTASLDLGDVEPSLAGPKRPQDRVVLSDVPKTAIDAISDYRGDAPANTDQLSRDLGDGFEVEDGDVVIAAITSCTNTSNPSVLVGAGLVAQRRRQGVEFEAMGEDVSRPGSQVVKDYLEKAELQDDLDASASTSSASAAPRASAIPDRFSRESRRPD